MVVEEAMRRTGRGEVWGSAGGHSSCSGVGRGVPTNERRVQLNDDEHRDGREDTRPCRAAVTRRDRLGVATRGGCGAALWLAVKGRDSEECEAAPRDAIDVLSAACKLMYLPFFFCRPPSPMSIGRC